MDSVVQIIKNLKKEEIRNFKIFTKRFQRQEDIKIATLFDLIRLGKHEDDDKKLLSALFPDDEGNANAYYRLKNRLKTELEKSLLNLHHNLDEKIGTINFITLSSVFSYKAQYELSLYYLKKAEKLALQNEFYDLLDFIYSQIIELSYNFNFDEINPIEYIEKRKENTRKNSVFMEANNAISAVSYSLRKANLNKAEDIDHALQKTLKELNIASEVYKIPNVKLKIHYCIRSILLQNKDFSRLEKYLIESLNDFETENLFTKSTHIPKIALISWIVNTLMINKKWPDAIKYTDTLLEELNKYNKLYYDNFIWTYYQSLITSYMSSDKITEAIELLEKIMELPAHKGVIFYEYAIYGNLALCYYFKKNNSEAIKILSRLFLKDIYPKLTTEYQFSISIVEVVLHFENANLDYVTYRIGEIKRQFRNLLKGDAFQEEKAFLKLLASMCNKADPMHDKALVAQMKSFANRTASIQIGSGKHIDFGLWIKAKLEKQHYYNYLYKALQA
jgi:tetratricopeptide (TPR) repeat protein